MKPLQSIAVLAIAAAASAASWSFEDATVSIASKSGGAASKEAIKPNSPISKPLSLSSDATLKLVLTTTNAGKGRSAHQVFLHLTSPSTGLSDAYPLTTKENGKATVSLAFKDIPAQLLRETSPLDAAIVIGNFGGSTPYKGIAFQLKIQVDPNAPLPAQEEQLRYGKQPEIHHVFRSDPKSPNRLITLLFTVGVLAALPILLGSWLALGGNVNHLGNALGAAPISHTLFVGSVLAMEGVFFLYYTTWNLFQVMPVAGVVGAVAFYSGSKALSEVQERRLAGLR